MSDRPQINLDQIATDFAAGRYGPATVRQLLQYARWQQEEIRRLQSDLERLHEAADTITGQRFSLEAKVAVVRQELGAME